MSEVRAAAVDLFRMFGAEAVRVLTTRTVELTDVHGPIRLIDRGRWSCGCGSRYGCDSRDCTRVWYEEFQEEPPRAFEHAPDPRPEFDGLVAELRLLIDDPWTIDDLSR